jgi:hypothetical protein
MAMGDEQEWARCVSPEGRAHLHALLVDAHDRVLRCVEEWEALVNGRHFHLWKEMGTIEAMLYRCRYQLNSLEDLTRK